MSIVLNKKKRYLSEILKDANESKNPIASLQEAYKEEVRSKRILAFCAHGGYKIAKVLPSGTPPFKESDMPLGLASVDVLCLHDKLDVLFRPDLKQSKREEMYIRWLEAMHPVDANILGHVKDQNLDVLYPNLTHEVIYQSLGWTKEQYEKLRS